MNNSITIFNPSAEVTFREMRSDPVRFPRLGAVPKEEAIYHVSKIVNDAFMYLGRAAEAGNVYYISKHLVEELLADEENLHTRLVSFAEIAKTIKRKIMTQEVYALSVSSLYRMVMDYVRTEGSMIQEELDREALARRKEEMRNSIIAPMLKTYAGKLIENNPTGQ